uniref:Lipid body protein 36 n=1 Tax=Lobosphaera incisa TaxID=312850 RepID=A0A1X9QDS0_9CHLO|nr:lipid body protein 36 [Lobosphaera incisa]
MASHDNLRALRGPREGRVDLRRPENYESVYDKMVDAFVWLARTFCTWAVPRFQPLLDFIVHHICEPVFARLTGSFYPPKAVLHRGQQPVSFISVTDPEFGVPLLDGKPLYNPANFPFDATHADAHGFHEWVAHFLILCAKVAYEREALIKMVVDREFTGIKFVDSFPTEPKEAANLTVEEKAHVMQEAAFNRLMAGADTANPAMIKRRLGSEHQQLANRVTATLIPDTMAFMITNDNAVILFFRGTEPHKLAQWWSDCDLELAVRTNAAGKVHQGFWEALFYKAPPVNGKKEIPSVFNRICAALERETRGNHKRIYVTGHSLGGGLTAMFAHTLAHPDTAKLPSTVGYKDAHKLVDRVGGVYTFASPTAGNHAFCDFLVYTYGKNVKKGIGKDRLFRVAHSSDVVVKIPFGQGYRHHKLEYYINYKGDIHHDPEDIEAWRVCESDQFDFFYLCKVLAGWTRWSPWGAPNGSWLWPDFWVFFMRCYLHTVIRVVAYTLGPLIPGHVISGVPDHFPCDYERKIRRVAVDLGRVLKASPEQRTHMHTHVLSRSEEHCDADVNIPVSVNGGHIQSSNGLNMK